MNGLDQITGGGMAGSIAVIAYIAVSALAKRRANGHATRASVEVVPVRDLPCIKHVERLAITETKVETLEKGLTRIEGKLDIALSNRGTP